MHKSLPLTMRANQQQQQRPGAIVMMMKRSDRNGHSSIWPNVHYLSHCCKRRSHGHSRGTDGLPLESRIKKKKWWLGRKSFAFGQFFYYNRNQNNDNQIKCPPFLLPNLKESRDLELVARRRVEGAVLLNCQASNDFLTETGIKKQKKKKQNKGFTPSCLAL